MAYIINFEQIYSLPYYPCNLIANYQFKGGQYKIIFLKQLVF
jgi:hypothetical protein